MRFEFDKTRPSADALLLFQFSLHEIRRRNTYFLQEPQGRFQFSLHEIRQLRLEGRGACRRSTFNSLFMRFAEEGERARH